MEESEGEAVLGWAEGQQIKERRGVRERAEKEGDVYIPT